MNLLQIIQPCENLFFGQFIPIFINTLLTHQSAYFQQSLVLNLQINTNNEVNINISKSSTFASSNLVKYDHPHDHLHNNLSLNLPAMNTYFEPAPNIMWTGRKFLEIENKIISLSNRQFYFSPWTDEHLKGSQAFLQ